MPKEEGWRKKEKFSPTFAGENLKFPLVRPANRNELWFHHYLGPGGVVFSRSDAVAHIVIEQPKETLPLSQGNRGVILGAQGCFDGCSRLGLVDGLRLSNGLLGA
jgi:hypothetical protein